MPVALATPRRKPPRGEAADRGCRRTDRVPALACEQRDRNQHAELRLVGEQADQEAGEPWPAVEQMERAAEQCGSEKTVLPMADIDEHRREGGRDQQRFGS